MVLLCVAGVCTSQTQLVMLFPNTNGAWSPWSGLVLESLKGKPLVGMACMWIWTAGTRCHSRSQQWRACALACAVRGPTGAASCHNRVPPPPEEATSNRMRRVSGVPPGMKRACSPLPWTSRRASWEVKRLWNTSTTLPIPGLALRRACVTEVLARKGRDLYVPIPNSGL